MDRATKWATEKFNWLNRVATDPALSSLAVRVALLISPHLDNETRSAFPGQETLGAKFGASGRTVRRAVDELETTGHLVVTRRHVNGKTRNTYRLPDPKEQGVTGQDCPVATGQDCPVDHKGNRTELTRATGQNCPPNPFKEPVQKRVTPSFPREAFAEWWANYPEHQNKVDQDGAWKLFAKALKTGATTEELLQGVRRYGLSGTVGRGIVCKPRKWLSEEYWKAPAEVQPLAPGERTVGFLEEALLTIAGRAA